MEKSLLLGDKLRFTFPAYSFNRKLYRIPSYGNDGTQRILVSARALERRQSSLDKWPEDGTPSFSRWDKVKPRFSPKEHWKPSRPKPGDADYTIRIVEDRDSRDEDGVDALVESRMKAEAGAHGEPVQPCHPFLAEAKKQAISVTDYLKALDVKKVFSGTAEPTSYPPFPPFTGTAIAGFGAVLLFGVILDALLWRLSKVSSARNVLVSNDDSGEGYASSPGRAPSALSVLLERDMRRKESVEWVNMVIGKLWNLYRRGLENWLVSLLQPIIDDLEKPDYVKKVQVKQFFLGDEPLTVRTVERRTSRRADDLQYHVGVRYTGGARLLLLITLKWAIIPITIPVGVRGLDVDSEVWVKLRMLPSDPWVGQATWAFVTLPKIKLALAPFRLVNLMAIPFLSIFLAKLLTEDLPMLFVRPNKNIIDFLQGRAIGPVSKDFKDGVMLDGSSSFSGELSVTLVEARRLSYIPYLKTDPYVIFVLGEQVLRSKKNSQTSIIGPPGEPVWNQDFKLLVVDQKKQHLSLTLHDTIGFTSYPVGSADIDLKTLQDTVPVDRKLTLKSGWGPFPQRFAGELILRLTFKAYIDDDEQNGETGGELSPKRYGLGGVSEAAEQVQEVATFFKEEAGKVADFFQEDLAKEMFSLSPISSDKDAKGTLSSLGLEMGDEKKINEMKTSTELDSPAAVSTENGFVDLGNQVVTDIREAKVRSKTKDSFAVTADVEKVTFSNGTREQAQNVSGPSRDTQVLIWLAVTTAIVWVVAADLNLANLFNP